jgi:hypothetical protein
MSAPETRNQNNGFSPAPSDNAGKTYFANTHVSFYLSLIPLTD